MCGGSHIKLMCPENVHQNKEETPNVTQSVVIQSVEGKSERSTSNLMVKEVVRDNVILTTMLIRNGEKEMTIRAAIDSGSQRRYLIKRLISELGLVKKVEETQYHELFGGHVTKAHVHNRYSIIAESLDGKFNCTFDVLDNNRKTKFHFHNI